MNKCQVEFRYYAKYYAYDFANSLVVEMGKGFLKNGTACNSSVLILCN